MDYLILVNKENPLESELNVEMMLAGKNSDNEDVFLEKKTGEAMLRMLDDVNKIYGERQVILNSGYRTLSEQQAVLDYYLKLEGNDAYLRVALPGTSEHHTGLCADVDVLKDGVYEEPTGEEDTLKWMRDNAYKYGFILRYPKGKETITGYKYEPWHFRYVGDSLIAKEIMESGITLEEYFVKNS